MDTRNTRVVEGCHTAEDYTRQADLETICEGLRPTWDTTHG